MLSSWHETHVAEDSWFALHSHQGKRKEKRHHPSILESKNDSGHLVVGHSAIVACNVGHQVDTSRSEEP